MKTNLTKTHDIDAAYKEFDFTDIAKNIKTMEQNIVLMLWKGESQLAI